MVTKHILMDYVQVPRSVLAKIHMVTKLAPLLVRMYECSVLAKIHMVTKLTILQILYR